MTWLDTEHRRGGAQYHKYRRSMKRQELPARHEAQVSKNSICRAGLLERGLLEL